VKLGPGLDDPQMGPLTTHDQFLRVQEFLKVGVEEGARVAVGGGLPSEAELRDGWFVQPTVFADVDNGMRIAQEEIFGPVLSVIRFRDEADAIRIANDSRYGLVAGVWTNRIDRAHRVAAELEAGQVFINSYFSGGVETPFGGSKSSGFGREKGVEAIHHYTQVKTITVPIDGGS
jgi:aldehyde dehydrogenase (NAD+)